MLLFCLPDWLINFPYYLTVPGVDDVIVRNLRQEFPFRPQNGTFDFNVTWQKPLFNNSRITSYVLKFRVHEGRETSTKTVNLSLSIFSSLTSLFLVTDLSISPTMYSSLCGSSMVERLVEHWDRNLVTLSSIASSTARYIYFFL